MNREEILESLKDLVLSLQDKEKCNSPRFRDEWLKKKVSTETAIDKLHKPDFDWLSSEYLKWATSYPFCIIGMLMSILA